MADCTVCGQAQGQWHCNQGSNTSTYIHVIFLWLGQCITLVNNELGHIFLQVFELSEGEGGHGDGQEKCLNWTQQGHNKCMLHKVAQWVEMCKTGCRDSERSYVRCGIYRREQACSSKTCSPTDPAQHTQHCHERTSVAQRRSVARHSSCTGCP